mgnify:CR=1 FL=1
MSVSLNVLSVSLNVLSAILQSDLTAIQWSVSSVMQWSVSLAIRWSVFPAVHPISLLVEGWSLLLVEGRSFVFISFYFSLEYQIDCHLYAVWHQLSLSLICNPHIKDAIYIEVHNLYDRNTPGEICPTVFIKDLIEVDSHCKGKEKSEKGLGYKLQKIANFLQNWAIDRYLQGFVKNVQEFIIPNRSSWPA